MKNNEAAGFDLRGDRLHQAAAVSGPVAGSQMINMLGDQALGAVVGVAVAFDYPVAKLADEIFGNFFKVFGHLFELKIKILAGGFGNSI